MRNNIKQLTDKIRETYQKQLSNDKTDVINESKQKAIFLKLICNKMKDGVQETKGFFKVSMQNVEYILATESNLKNIEQELTIDMVKIEFLESFENVKKDFVQEESEQEAQITEKVEVHSDGSLDLEFEYNMTQSVVDSNETLVNLKEDLSDPRHINKFAD